MKQGIREELLNKRLEHKNVEEDSKKIIESLLSLPTIKNAHTVMIYYPHKNEVNLIPLFEILTFQGKKVLFPKIHKKEMYPIHVNSLNNLKKGSFGILEPEGRALKNEDIDVVIVPAIAFDKNGHRVGYGKGFYDRFLKNFNGFKVGVAYDFQVLENLPYQEHDIPVDIIITPTKIIKVNKEEDKND